MNKIADPELYAGSCKDLKDFVIRLRIKLEGNADRFGFLRAATMYTISRLQGDTLPQVSAYISGPQSLRLKEPEEIITILAKADGDPNPVATAKPDLQALTQGTREFSTYWAEIPRWATRTSWNDKAKMSHFQGGLKLRSTKT